MSNEWPPTPDGWPTDPVPDPYGAPADHEPSYVTPESPASAPPFAGPDFSAAPGHPPAPYLPNPYPPAQYPPAQYPPAPYPPAPHPTGQYPVQYPQAPQSTPLYVPGHYNEDGQYVPPLYSGAQYPQAQYPQAQYPQAQYGAAPQQWPSAAPVPVSPARQKPGLRRQLMVGLWVVPMVMVMMWANATFLQPARPVSTSPTATASTPTAKPSGTASASPSPSGSPTATMPTDPKVLVKSNPIYAVKVSAKCPDQARPSSTSEFRSQVKGLVACENTAWKAALASTPVKFSKPKVKFYENRTTSPCGRLGTSFPAAYCSTDRTIYFSVASYMQGRYFRLAVAAFVMHEYAHHVQQLAGILSERDALRETAQITTRRVELQAHCLAHYGLNHAGLGFDSIDREDAEYQFSYASDPNGHGSATAKRYWGRRGLSAATVGACNTWSVKAGKVK